MDNKEVILDVIHDSLLKVVGVDSNGRDLIGEVDFKLGKNHIQGQVIMIEPELHDILVFYLLRKMFCLDFPMAALINYQGWNKYIIVKRFMYRSIKESDYYPHYPGNKEFRLRLAILVFFCKFVGCPIVLRNIRVIDGIPFYWRANCLGMKKSSTLNDEDFTKVFGVNLIDLNKSKNNWNDICEEVIDYFKDIDFDTDVLRGYLFLREDIVKWSKGQKMKYKLSNHPRKIAGYIETNYSLLLGDHPFKIFKY